MRATLSSTASGTWCRDERLAALPYISQQLGVDLDVTPRRRRSDEGIGEAGGGGLKHGVGELLSVLHLSSTLVGRRGFPDEDTSALHAELMELVDRSWQLLEHLVESTTRETSVPSDTAAPLFLEGLRGVRQGPASERMERPAAEMLTDVRAEAGRGRRGIMLEETAAGWIAC